MDNAIDQYKKAQEELKDVWEKRADLQALVASTSGTEKKQPKTHLPH
jgi:hypothetical protein